MERTPFAVFLIHKRKEAGLSQRGLADALGVTQTKVHGWERGSRSPHARYLLHLFSTLKLGLNDQQMAIILLAQS